MSLLQNKMEHAIHEDTDALTNNETIFSGGHGKEEVASYYNKWANRYEKVWLRLLHLTLLSHLYIVVWEVYFIY